MRCSSEPTIFQKISSKWLCVLLGKTNIALPSRPNFWRHMLHREMLEETGWRIEQPTQITRVRQRLITRSDQTPYTKDCHIFTAHLTQRPHPGRCDLQWVAPDKLAHACFRWIIAEFAA